MSATTYTLKDVVEIVGWRVSDFKGDVDTVENPDPAMKMMVECVNSVLRILTQMKGLPMMNARDTITTADDYTTGTVAISNGSTTVTGTDTVFTAGMVGRAFATSSKNVIYRIASYTSATAITLDKAWSDDDVSGEGYTIAQDRYDLPSDFGNFIEVTLEGSRSRTLDIKASSEIARQRASRRIKALTVGAPTMISIFDRASSGVRQCELDYFPDDEYRVIIQYQKVPSRLLHDNAVLPIFDKNIDTLMDGVEAKWKSITGASPEDKAAWTIWQRTEMARFMAFDREKTDEMTRLMPENVTRNQAAPAGPYDWGSS